MCCKDWRAEWESGDLGFPSFHPCRMPHPPPNQPILNPCRSGRQAARGGEPAGRQSARTTLASASRSVSVQGKRPLKDAAVPSKRPDAPPILHHLRPRALCTSTSPFCRVSQAGSGIFHMLHPQLQLLRPLVFDMRFPAVATRSPLNLWSVNPSRLTLCLFGHLVLLITQWPN